MTDKQKKQALLLIAFLVIIKLVLVPWGTWLKNTSANIGRLTETEHKFAAVTNRGVQLKALQQQIDKNYQALEKSWIDEKASAASVKILRHVQSTADKFGIQLKNSDVGVKQAGDVPSYPVSLYFEATPEQSMMYIQALESAMPAMELAKMSIYKPNFKASTLRVSLAFMVLAAPEQS